jgi:predicted phage terminase large subunit-like protein
VIYTKAYFGEDETGHGFFWASSKQKLKEALSLQRNAPTQFKATYQCDPGSVGGAIFLKSDFSYYPLPENWKAFIETGDMVVQSWDTAGSTEASADYTVCITAMLKNCSEYHSGEDEALLGPCEDHFDIYVLDVYRDRIDFGSLVTKARELAREWNPSTVLIEQKSTGDPLLSTLRQAGLPVEGMKPGLLSKKARVTMSRGAGSAQGWFRQRRVRFAYGAPWVKGLEQELTDFSGDDTGKDDQVDAMTYLTIWAIEQGGGVARLPTGVEQYEKEASTAAHTMPWETLLDPKRGFDPFQATCDRCSSYEKGKQFCLHHNRKTFALNSCQEMCPKDLLFAD